MADTIVRDTDFVQSSKEDKEVDFSLEIIVSTRICILSH